MIGLGILSAITELLNARKNRILTIAQTALPDSQFQAFKKLFLDEFGQRGLEADLKKLLAQHGMEGNGREHTTQERGCHHE
jgi:hypothetical protein